MLGFTGVGVPGYDNLRFLSNRAQLKKNRLRTCEY